MSNRGRMPGSLKALAKARELRHGLKRKHLAPYHTPAHMAKMRAAKAARRAQRHSRLLRTSLENLSRAVGELIPGRSRRKRSA